MLIVEGLGEVGFKLKPVQARGQNGGLLCRQIDVDFVRHEGFFEGEVVVVRLESRAGDKRAD